MPDSTLPTATGEITELQGKIATVRLQDGRLVRACFPRRVSIFGSVVGWIVEVQFRMNPNRPALIVKASRNAS
jgi:hypothetical protein